MLIPLWTLFSFFPFFFFLFLFSFFHFLTFSYIFLHSLSFSFILFHSLSFSFILFHSLSFSFIFFHFTAEHACERRTEVAWSHWQRPQNRAVKARDERLHSTLAKSDFWPNRHWPNKFDRLWPSLFDRLWPNRLWPTLIGRLWPSRLWPKLVFQSFGSSEGWGAEGWGAEGWGLKGGAPKGRTHPETVAFGPPGFHTTARELQTCTFQCTCASNTTKIPREDTQRDTKRAKRWWERGKKTRNFGLLYPSGPHPSAPHPSEHPKKTETPIWAKVGLAKVGQSRVQPFVPYLPRPVLGSLPVGPRHLGSSLTCVLCSAPLGDLPSFGGPLNRMVQSGLCPVCWTSRRKRPPFLDLQS